MQRMLTEEDDILVLTAARAITLYFCLNLVMQGILGHQIAEILLYFEIFRHFFQFSLIATLGSISDLEHLIKLHLSGSIEF